MHFGFDVEELVKEAERQGKKSLILAEENLGYALKFYNLCIDAGIKPVIGQKITLDGQRVLLLCKDMDGYRILCRHSAFLGPENLLRKKLQEEECSHFIFTTEEVVAEEQEKLASQIPYIFPRDYFSFENRCKRMMENLPDVPFPAGINSAADYFVSLVNKGIKFRYGEPTPEIRQRVQHEVDIILGHHFEKYFLILWEIAAMCRKRGIFYVTRFDKSSSSIVCYLLRITDIDPLKYNLFFEFFFNIERGIFPTVTFPLGKDILQHLKNIYGDDCVASKAFPESVIITKDPVCNHIPVTRDRGRLTGWWDEYSDVLRLVIRGPGFFVMLSETYDLIRVKKDKTFTLSSIKYSDRKTSNWFKAVRLKSFSRFMFEKEVKKQFSKMKLDCSFSDIILLEAFDFFPQALGAEAAADLYKKKRARNFPAEVEKILAETYGKLIYQEQFVQLVQTVAGWDFAKADMLRRNMGKRKYDEIKKSEKEFIEYAVGQGFSEDSARELFEYLCESSIYLVSKAYSIGQARLLWIESYFRAHYPSVFISME